MISIEKQNKLKHEYLLSQIEYNPTTGIFKWIVSKGRIKEGSIAGYKRKDGYYIIMIDGKKYRSNRIAWFYINKSWPIGIIDHINGDNSDNRIDNLRDVSLSYNQHNQRKPHSRNKSDANIPGVSFFRNKWVVRLWLDGRSKIFGKFDNKEEAENKCIELRRIYYPGNLL